MNISIIGPEESGKSTIAASIAKKCAHGRPIYIISDLPSAFNKIALEEFRTLRHAVVILDDANAFLENYDMYRRELKLKDAIVKARHYNRVNIFVFHTLDDAVKVPYRNSRYVYVSKKYRDSSVSKDKHLQGVEPVEIGRKSFLFLRYKRY